MSLLDLLASSECWEAFYEYKTHLACPKDLARELGAFISEKAYLPVCEAIDSGEAFPLPRRAVISKLHSLKKRTVYIYPRRENTVLKLLTFLLLRKYDGLFADGLYSFRPGRSAKDAIRRLRRTPGLERMYSYKVDISNYFNSVPVTRLLPMLEETVGEDAPLLAFLERLLTEPAVLERGEPIVEEKGIMAGTPLSAFYANLYLRDLDRLFAEEGILYARYSDDIIVFAPTREETEVCAARIRGFLAGRGLRVNPAKECRSDPSQGFTFLGFSYRSGVIDIAPASVDKLKQKMRRKTRALKRWQKRNGLSGEKAARAFIRIFNRKLLESSSDSDLTWSYWYFSVIDTAKSLAVIDRYAQDCLRYLISDKRTKGRYGVRYADLKRLGYQSLVHAYYEFGKETK
ncbi:MAG: group II intron reverse transcriptase domain-containing protein [Lachnospiraceae bacterium]|nr:group II intron reverse transcriptase domain-containing protein [Lachnospiraceae bacterium]